eukprot:scaffold97780_cov34-Prasinocladus_malaysianus.AAC.2
MYIITATGLLTRRLYSPDRTAEVPRCPYSSKSHAAHGLPYAMMHIKMNSGSTGELDSKSNHPIVDA